MARKEKLLLGWLPSPIGGISCLQQSFMDSVIGFINYDSSPEIGRGIYAGYTFSSTGYIASGRNQIIEQFLDSPKLDADWFLMLDWDITFKPEDVYKLIDEAGKDHMKIVSGCYLTYFGEDNLLRPCWMHQVAGQDYIPVTSFVSDEVMPLTVCGMGFTLMHKDLLKKMRKKYKHDPWPWFGHDIINGSRVGEDITFTKRARDIGATVWGHGGVLLGHTKVKTLRVEDMANTQYARSLPPETKIPPLRKGQKTILSVGAGTDVTFPLEFSGYDLHTLDLDPRTSPSIVADGKDLSKIPDNYYDALYCSHNLEHYQRHDTDAVLKGFYRVLKSGGEVYIRVPDLGTMMKRVVSEGLDIDDSLYESPAGPITAKDMMLGHAGMVAASGESFMEHKAGFSKKSLTKLLKETGFKSINIDESNLELVARAKK